MPADPAHIFLVGPMGSGKTTIGRRVAEHLGMPFRDCDEEIEQRTGASVNLIFDIEGEAGFRKRESQLLRELSEGEPALIATGGGAVLSAANRDLMGSRGLVVWLQTSVDQQILRLQNDKKRPLLQAPDRRARLHALAQERDPLYAEVADLVFQSRNRSAAAVAHELAGKLRALLSPAGQDGQHAAH